MTQSPNDPDSTELAPASEREHGQAIASLQALEQATSRDWQDVALGQRDLDEVAASRAAAGDDAESIERAKALFRPYDDLEQRRLVDALLTESGKPHATEPAANDAARFPWAAALGLVAVAVAILVVVFAGPGGSTDSSPRVAELPAYVIETDGGLAKTRSTPPPEHGPVHYAPTNEFEWIIRPAHDIAGPLPAVRVIARDVHGRVTPLSPTILVADSGALRLTGTIAELGLGPGEWTIEVVLLRTSGWHVDAVVVAKPMILEPST